LPIQLDASANGSQFTLNPDLFVPIVLFAGVNAYQRLYKSMNNALSLVSFTLVECFLLVSA